MFIPDSRVCNKNLNKFLTRMRKLFQGGYYSRKEIIWGNKVLFCAQVLAQDLNLLHEWAKSKKKVIFFIGEIQNAKFKIHKLIQYL